jgi:RHS repeat-associated protein
METTSTATTAGVPYAKVRWTYDPLGRRIQRESWQGANPVVVTKYVYDGWQCLAELDGSNGVTATYAWGIDLSGSRTGAGGVGGLLWVNHTQHGRHFYSYDGNGNVCGLTSATDGTRTGGHEYDPFGGIIRANEVHPVAGWNEWQHSTKRFDRVTALSLFEYRHYSANSGKWLSRDPLAEIGFSNLSAYAGNNPTSIYDYLGLCNMGDLLKGIIGDALMERIKEIIRKQVLKTAAKAGIAAVADGPLPIGDIVAAGLSIYDGINLTIEVVNMKEMSSGAMRSICEALADQMNCLAQPKCCDEVAKLLRSKVGGMGDLLSRKRRGRSQNKLEASSERFGRSSKIAVCAGQSRGTIRI